MRKISIPTLRLFLNQIANNPTITQKELAQNCFIGLRSVSRYFRILREQALDPKFLVDKPVEELELIFGLQTKEKNSYIEPDFKEVWQFMHPKVSTNYAQPKIKDAWLHCYVKHHLGKAALERLKLTGVVGKDDLPSNLMSFITFYRRYLKALSNILPTNVSSTASIRYLPGAQSMIDGAGDPLHWIDKSGGEHKAYVLVGVLPYSGLTFAYAAPDATTSSWVNFIIEMFYYFGGVTTTLKSDNDVALVSVKRVLDTATKKPLSIKTPHASVSRICNQFNTSLVLTGCRAPRNKADAEAAVYRMEKELLADPALYQDYEKRRLIAADLTKLNSLIKQRCDFLNSRTLEGKQYSRRAFFEQNEREYLKALPNVKPVFNYTEYRVVKENGYVRYKDQDFFLGLNYKGVTVLCVLKAHVVEFDEFETLKKIDEYDFEESISVGVIKHKHAKYMSDKEKAVNRSEEDFIRLGHVTLISGVEVYLKMLQYIWGREGFIRADNCSHSNMVLKLFSKVQMEQANLNLVLNSCSIYLQKIAAGEQYNILTLCNEVYAALYPSNKKTTRKSPTSKAKRRLKAISSSEELKPETSLYKTTFADNWNSLD